MITVSPGTSIIICAHNRLRDLTIPCIESIRRNTRRPHELILVDDASVDGTIDYFRSQSRKAYRLEGEPHGPGIPRNLGLMAAQGAKRIVFIDNDALMPARWLGRLIDGQRAGGAGIVAAMPSDKATDRYAFDTNALAMKATGLLDVNEVPFACALVTMPVYSAVGFFDPALSWGGEDTDYCFRAKQKGFKVHVMPNVVFEHRAHGTMTLGNANRRESLRRFHQKWPGGVSMSSR